MLLRFCVYLFFVGAWSAECSGETIPAKSDVREQVLRNFRFEPFVLSGRLRTERRSYPLVVVTEGDRMMYHFMDQEVHVRVKFSSTGNEVWTANSMNGPWRLLPRERHGERILDSDATYEDLALNFIHWRDVTMLGRDSIKTIPAFGYEAMAPTKGSEYHRIRYWVGTETYALLRADAYNAANQVVKRLEVNGVMRLGDAVTIKELQISTLIPGRDLSASRTYIEIRRAERRAGR